MKRTDMSLLKWASISLVTGSMQMHVQKVKNASSQPGISLHSCAYGKGYGEREIWVHVDLLEYGGCSVYLRTRNPLLGESSTFSVSLASRLQHRCLCPSPWILLYLGYNKQSKEPFQTANEWNTSPPQNLPST